MKLLVTGGAGFIGSHLTRRLLAAGHHVLVFDKLTYAGQRATLVDLETHANFSFQQSDITDTSSVRQAFAEFAPQAIFHLAAETHVDRSIAGPAPFIHTNIVGTYTLLAECLAYYQGLSSEAQATFRFVHVSTDEVYGSLESKAPPFTESSPYHPNSPYSASKAGADHLVRAWHHTYGLPTLITNGSNNYGPYQHPEKLVPVTILHALQKQPIPVYGDGQQRRDWIYVEDHVAALELILQQGRPGETYHVGGNTERANLALVERICRLLDDLRPRLKGGSYQEFISHVPDRPGHDLRYAMDFRKLERELGWAPEHALEDALRKTVQWYLNHQAWWQRLLPSQSTEAAS